MIWVDYCIVALLIVSTIVGVLRGFAREVLGLITWVLAVWLALTFGAALGHRLEPYIAVQSVRISAAYALLFLAVLLAGGITTALIVRGLRGSLLSSTDRTLGGGFGLLRGALLIAAFIIVVGMTPARQDLWWQQSVLLKQFNWLADGLRTLLPESWLEKLKPADEDNTVVPEAVPASL